MANRRAVTLSLSLILAACGGSDKDSDKGSARTETPAEIRFTEVSADVGLGEFQHMTGAFGDKWFPETMGSGLAVIDYDNDGWLDLMVGGGGVWPESNQEPPQAVRLYRNDRGRFVEAEFGVLPDLQAYNFGITTADYDNDGDTDAFVTTLDTNILLRNDGGRFTEVSEASGLTNRPGWSMPAVFFDADGDGWLDLFVGTYVHWSPEEDLWCSTTGHSKMVCTPEVYEGAPAEFYRNNRDGTFEERTVEAGFGNTGKTLGAIALDYDRDGWLDLLVANDTDPDQLFRNNGDGTFVDVGVRAGIAFDERGRARAGMGVAAGYLDDDDFPSVFVTNFSDEMVSVFRNLGSGVFLDQSAASGIGRVTLRTLGFGLCLFDADLDGESDLFVVNGHIQPDIGLIRDNLTYKQPPHLFINNGTGRFTDVAPAAGLDEPFVGRGGIVFDYDRDGDLDVAATENGGSLRLWRNEMQTPGASVRIRLSGSRTNRQGIGSEVLAYSGEREQRRMITAGSSYLSTSEPVATFGFASARPDSIVVRWASGGSMTIESPRIGVEYLVEEDGPVTEVWESGKE